MDKQTAIIRIIFLYLLCLASWTSGSAQSSASPFDILPRLPKVADSDSTFILSGPSNPFDIERLSMDENRPSGFTPQFKIKRKQTQLSAKEKTAIYERFLLFAVIIMLVIITLVVMVFRIFISRIWKAFLNDNMLSQLLREQGSGAAIGYAVLYLVSFINIGLFAFLILRYYGVKVANSNINTLFLCIGGIAIYFLTKHLLMTLVRSIFPIEKEVSQYNFTLMVFNIITGIFLAPMILFIAYGAEGVQAVFIKLTIFLLAGSIIFRGLRGLFIASRFFAWHKFHFLLYLCAIELAPLIVTLKLLEVL